MNRDIANRDIVTGVVRTWCQALGYRFVTQVYREMQSFRFPVPAESATEKQLRTQVREFLAAELATGGFVPRADCWVSAPDAEFSKKLGDKGWLGMTWPRCYGGQDRPMIERLAVTEELLLAGAPVAAHWIADRQSGSQLLRYGTEEQKQKLLPAIASGHCYFAIGMSESMAGSDLAAIRTTAQRDAGGWRLNGVKMWSTGAHFAHYMIVLARTESIDTNARHHGMSQFLVDLSLPHITIEGIKDLTGSRHFNEVRFDNTYLPDSALLGQPGAGWQQCISELALERSGPERYLTTLIVLQTLLQQHRHLVPPGSAMRLGAVLAELTSLRTLSRGIAALLDAGESPDTEAAIVKVLGTRFERNVLDVCRFLLHAVPYAEQNALLTQLLRESIQRLPSYSIRGGATDVLRGVIARQMGVRK